MTGTARLGVAALALGLWGLTGSAFPAPDDAPDFKARTAAAADILQLCDDLKTKTDDEVRIRARALAARHELEYVMRPFKLRTRGGFGLGPFPDAITPDGIELKLRSLARKPPTAAELKGQRAALLRMPEVVEAVMTVAHYAPQGKKKPCEWVAYTWDVRNAAKELRRAVRVEDPNAVRDAAHKLTTACANCHSVFRDL
jgi:hypothetical protein